MDQQRKAIRALQLLEDPVLMEAMEAARETFNDEWLSAETLEGREAAWAKTHALAEVLRHLVWLAEQKDPEPGEKEERSTPVIP